MRLFRLLLISGTRGDASAYIAQPDVAYDAGTWKEKSQHNHDCILLRGLEGYTQWRRLDAPT